MEEGCGGPLWEEGGVVVEGLGEGWDYLGGGVEVWGRGWGGGCHGFFVVVVCTVGFGLWFVVVGYVLYCIVLDGDFFFVL